MIEDIEYNDGSVRCTGVLAYDASIKERRPGVLVVHEAWGLGEHAISRTKALAEMGYVALAADVYGAREQAADESDMVRLGGPLRADAALFRARMGAAIERLRGLPQVDGARIASIGFCFGGTASLEIARSGLDVRGVVCFHGRLDTPAPALPGAVRARVLVCTGADDPIVPREQIDAFEDEMRHAAADWQIIVYGNTAHSFTNPNAGKPLPIEGLAYNELSDRRSWAAMSNFLEEIFAG